MRRAALAAVVVVALVLATLGVVLWSRGRQPVLTELVAGNGVSAAVYDLGVDAVATRSGGEQLSAAVYYPSDLGGRHRLVLIQHGGHTQCADPSDAYPCAAPEDRADSALGYGYLGEALARAGYVAVSISAERTVSSAYTDEHSTVMNAHLALWQSWATSASGAFGATFVDHLDLSSVGLIGHSRGGEAMARYAAGRAGAAPAVDVSGVLLIAPALPVDGGAPSVPPDPMAVLMGTCDGDVGHAPAGYVSALAPSGSTADRTLVTVTGANHNFYNTRWTPGSGLADAIDDADLAVAQRAACRPGSPTRLTPSQQQTVASELAVAFFDAASADRSTARALENAARGNASVTVTSVA